VSEGYPIQGRLSFDEAKVAEGLGLSVDDVRAYFRDGRRAQPVRTSPGTAGGRRRSWAGGRCLTFAPGEKPPFRSLASGGLVVERPARFDVRVVVRELSFAPSWMKGTGRSFDPEAFRRYYENERMGVFVVDVLAWPLCPYWRVPSHAIFEWAEKGLLGATARVKREDLPRLLEGWRP